MYKDLHFIIIRFLFYVFYLFKIFCFILLSLGYSNTFVAINVTNCFKYVVNSPQSRSIHYLHPTVFSQPAGFCFQVPD